MAPHLHDAVVVITGASSGIGRCAALRFARHQSRLVLSARGASALGDTAAACESEGAQAVAVPPTSETRPTCRGSLEQPSSGGIDVWVNNAGVIVYCPFEQIPSEIFRAVIDTNLMGQVHGGHGPSLR